MGAEILTRLGDNVASLKLIPGSHGVFDVRINGQLVGEHTHDFAVNLYILPASMTRLFHRLLLVGIHPGGSA